MLVIDEKNIKVVILLLIIIIIILVIRLVVRFIGWIFRSIRYLFTGKRSRRNNALNSNDWLTRAQARQEIRFQNSMPPVIASEMKSKKKRKRRK